jgi:hypothetical protein
MKEDVPDFVEIVAQAKSTVLKECIGVLKNSLL